MAHCVFAFFLRIQQRKIKTTTRADIANNMENRHIPYFKYLITKKVIFYHVCNKGENTEHIYNSYKNHTIYFNTA